MHVLLAIRPSSLRSRFQSNFFFTHQTLRKDLKRFMAHDIKLSDYFQPVDPGPPGRAKTTLANSRDRSKGNNNSADHHNNQTVREVTRTSKNVPICLWPPLQAKRYRHFLKVCTACPKKNKSAVFKALSEANDTTGPSRSTRAQIRDASSTGTTDNKDRVAG